MSALCILDWRAWAPGLDSVEAWQAWAHAPQVQVDDGSQPACGFLPAMQRRRLSRLARMTLETAWPLCADDEQLPFVFASRHGETPRTLELLTEIAAGQPLSPTRFGLSVHNAVAGQWSILRRQHGESVALAGGRDSFEHGVLEARLQLAAGAPAVLLVVAEEMPPPAYAGHIDDVPFSYALALRLAMDDGVAPGWELTPGRRNASATPCPWPHALDLLRACLAGGEVLEHTGGKRTWTWKRLR